MPKLYPASDELPPDWIYELLEGIYHALGHLRSGVGKASEARRKQLQMIRLDEDTLSQQR